MGKQESFNAPNKSYESELNALRKLLKKQQDELDRCSRVERSLRESEKNYRFLVENSGDIIWKIDMQARWTFVSSNVEKVLGYKPEEVIGRTVWDFTVPSYHSRLKEKLEKRLQGKFISPYEVEVIAKDGRHLPFEVLTTPIYDKAGHIVGIQGISRDIEERRQAEQKLKKYYDELEVRVEQRTAELDHTLGTLRAVLETVPTGILVADRGTEEITYASPGAATIFQCDITGTIASTDRGAFKLLHTDGTPFPYERLPLVQSLRHGTQVRNVEILVRKMDGPDTITLVNSAPVLDTSGHITAAVASISDITYLKRTEAALRDEKEQADLYIDLMGHDINNMNHIAMGYLELAIDTVKDAGHMDRDQLALLLKPLDMMKSSSQLIDNVRKIQRLREGGLKHEVLDLRPILSDITSEYSHIAAREVTIRLDGLSTAPVQANPLVKDVFTNIVGNAIKHSTGPLQIDIRLDGVTARGKKFYRVTVEDNGPGIPDKLKRELLFRKKLSGKGLGIYLVRTFIKQFNGRFRIEDRVPGDHKKGAKFVVTLPAA